MNAMTKQYYHDQTERMMVDQVVGVAYCSPDRQDEPTAYATQAVAWNSVETWLRLPHLKILYWS